MTAWHRNTFEQNAVKMMSKTGFNRLYELACFCLVPIEFTEIAAIFKVSGCKCIFDWCRF